MSLKNSFRLRAGCVCFINADCKNILVVQSLKTPEAWCLPGGGIEGGESAHFAAKRELFEEAGVLANINQCIGVFKNGSRVTLMFEATMTNSLDDWPEKNDRQRGWFATENVPCLLKSDYQRFILQTWSLNCDAVCCPTGINFTSAQKEADEAMLMSLVEETNAKLVEQPPPATSDSKEIHTDPSSDCSQLFPEHESGKVPLFVFETARMTGIRVGCVDICGLNLSNISQRIDEVIAQVHNSESPLPLTA